MSNQITSSLPPLYQREGDYIPRVAAVHDLCGYGKCSLGVAIPVLSAAGCDVCPVPTGLFSSHTAFPGWYMHDTTAILPDYLEAWKGRKSWQIGWNWWGISTPTAGPSWGFPAGTCWSLPWTPAPRPW